MCFLRLPPKFVKAANGAGKALYAARYGYSTVPLPPHVLLQTNLARKEVHYAGGKARNRKPSIRRPRRRPEYASKYQDYIPNNRPPKKKQRGYRPPKRKQNKHRPPYKEPEYYDEDELEEESDEIDYEYDDRPWKYRDNKDYEDFLRQHSKLRGNAYSNVRGKRGKKRIEEEGAYSEHPTPVYVRKPKPYTKNWSGSSRPTTNKLYSSTTAGLSSRPSFAKEEGHLYEEGNEERRPRSKYKPKRYRAKDEDRFRDQEEERRYRDNERNRFDNYRNWQASGDSGHRERPFEDKHTRRERVVNFGVGHSKEEREFNSKVRDSAKFVKDTRVKEWDEEDPKKLRRPTVEKGNYRKSSETEKWNAEEQDTEFRRNRFQIKQEENWKNEDRYQQMKRPAENGDQNERLKMQEKDTVRNVNKETTETQIPPQMWATQLPTQLPNWGQPQFHVIPSITPILLPSEIPLTWNNNLQNQQNWNNVNQNNLQGRWLEEPIRWNTQNAEQLPLDLNNDNRWRTKLATKINQKEDNRVVDSQKGNNEVVTVAQRVVQTTLGWQPENIRKGEIRDLQKWNSQENSSPPPPLQFPPSDLNTQPQWPQNNIPSPEAQLNAGEIVYGSRFKNENQNRKEPDIGFGQGMEVLDNIGGWQVY